MAWPLSRFTTFVANTVPAITKSFLDAVQDAIIKLHDGTITLKSLLVDGTGGIAASIPAGEVRAKTLRSTDTASGTTKPTTSVELGRTYREGIPLGWAYVDATGALIRGYNVHDCVRTVDPGTYVVTLHAVPSQPTQCIAVGMCLAGDRLVNGYCEADANGRVKATLLVTEGSSAGSRNASFYVVFYGF